MAGVITTIIIGIIVCFLAIRNMNGDISTLHSYHRNNVKEEDVKPFGKLVGIGTLLCGVSVIIFSALQGVSLLTGQDIYVIIGTFLLFGLLTAGLVITVIAMKKYNGGVF
jgi:hypothetical protein